MATMTRESAGYCMLGAIALDPEIIYDRRFKVRTEDMPERQRPLFRAMVDGTERAAKAKALAVQLCSGFIRMDDMGAVVAEKWIEFQRVLIAQSPMGPLRE